MKNKKIHWVRSKIKDSKKHKQTSFGDKTTTHMLSCSWYYIKAILSIKVIYIYDIRYIYYFLRGLTVSTEKYVQLTILLVICNIKKSYKEQINPINNR